MGLDHMGFGLVLGEDGKKFKTRSGDTVKLEMLLDEAAERAKQTLRQRAGEGDEDAASKTYLSEADFEVASKIVGYGAVKYSDLKNSRTTTTASATTKCWIRKVIQRSTCCTRTLASATFLPRDPFPSGKSMLLRAR